MLTTKAAELGAIVRQRRIDRGMSQTDLGERIGATRQWISRFEKGATDVTLARTLAILHELDLTLDIRPRERPAVSVLSPETMARLNASITRSLSEAFPEPSRRRLSEALTRFADQRKQSLGSLDLSVLELSRRSSPLPVPGNEDDA